MARLDAARVDVATLRDVALGYDSVGEALAVARARLAGLTFDGSVAGRAHATRGDALRTTMIRLDDALRRWSGDVAAVAAAVRAAADGYARADAAVAERLV
jgi:hypothetical protein